MPTLETPEIVRIVIIALFTTVAAVTDLRIRRIPNYLTLPLFVAGIIFQAVFFGWGGLFDATKAFGFGFGTFFILWMIGGGGGGDAKLIGALSVWLGVTHTVGVLVLSVIFVILGTGIVVVYGAATRGFGKTRERYLSKQITRSQTAPETVGDRQNRRIMTYAFPVALATWIVMLYPYLKP